MPKYASLAWATPALALLLAACGGGSSNSASDDLRVQLVVTIDWTANQRTAGAPCDLSDYNVTLTNQGGSVLGQETITHGPSAGTITDLGGGNLGCSATVDFGKVSKQSQYGVKVDNTGSGHAGNVVYFSQAQRQADNNLLSLTDSGD